MTDFPAAVEASLETPADGRAADRLAVRGLAIHGHHGVFDFERRDGQEFVVDLVLSLDTRTAARTDDLRETVDYGTLVDEVRSAVENDPVDLIETLAQRIADTCLGHARVEAVEVTVHKPHAPIQTTFDDVALTIHRRRQ
jgi:dihydroneopterin aldolase